MQERKIRKGGEEIKDEKEEEERERGEGDWWTGGAKHRKGG